jgi:Fe-S-cluster containining protein
MEDTGSVCQTCGACCVFSHTWPELGEEDPDSEDIPLELVDCETGRMKCDGDRCLALEGVVGKKVRCTVYAHRPKVCREFSPQNRPHDCNTVRAHSGLPPLPNAARRVCCQQCQRNYSKPDNPDCPECGNAMFDDMPKAGRLV